MSGELVPQQKERKEHKESIPYNISRAVGPSINLYPLENYTFGVKEAMLEKDTSVSLF